MTAPRFDRPRPAAGLGLSGTPAGLSGFEAAAGPAIAPARAAIGPGDFASAAILVALALLSASCSVAPSLTGLSARSYVEVGSLGLELHLMRDRSAAWGSWEDRGSGDFGLAEGRVDGAGDLSLRLYSGGAAAPPATIEGTLSDSGRRIEGMYAAPDDGSPRRLVLARRNGTGLSSSLRLARVESGSSGANSDLRHPTLFRAVGLEPERPERLRDWYRATFLGGEPLDLRLERRRDAFVASYRSAVGPAAKRGEARPDARWSYTSRQFVVFRSPSLLSLGTRVSSYVGGIHGTVETRFAAIDTVELRVLGPEDFLQGDWQDGLAQPLTAKLRDELALAPGASLVAAGFDGESMRPGKDLAVAASGIAFYYAPGSIAAREAGEYWIFLDWESLGPFLRPGVLERYGLGRGPGEGGRR
ncbi:MAG: hypothetical protein M0Z80_03065 [Treponema sp.]|nr:hypothetical protein [Treponema sp.]